ncbi:hypothetical protein A3752_05145 [Oleiphilus sp. HI0081]|uniref:polysaccharide deacetylase family protein n=1 Tax=unclassified Oleiphilus TaxID=2631174 RepID=UPI0007C33378|nr:MULTISPECIES: polysaccharide deacetylase family protein [unclassified Oleiphilus]KZY78348.1 hypothetical protein A3740_00970 [Oleiphilus sp. HI0068]KZY78507.1 hypothetical protein A3741_08560 [Oleiphilus sp. HI0069]KZY88971.1 hypothetical protein A3743_09830 [Oleiphilus sp. HI0072]KZZ07301.1 hypothetical protein A3749_15705 [Oleiphilus sp. HI0078]KZZ25103.1 hypothetical protein A3752_05145 [Oleiphilus sp. HI0081]KZZ46751.1 hypothetical protein A3755_17800 [Oleiphilus sp. HI0085]
MNKKKLLSSLFSHLGLLPLLRLYDSRAPSLKILAYHRVMDIDVDKYLFDQHLVDASVEDFDRQMKFLSSNYNVLPLSEAIDAFENAGNREIVSLTFDDGFDDLYHNVFPILKKYNIRPTIFITTGLIGTSDTLWSERLVYALKSNIGRTLSAAPDGADKTIEIQLCNVETIIEDFLRFLKRIPDDKRQQRLLDLFEELGIEREQSYPDSKMMTWDMVEEMSDWGVEFGSHSVTHSVLANLDVESMKAELFQSKDAIEKRIGRCEVLAYPVGGVGAFNQDVMDAAKEAGFKVACSYLSGVVSSIDQGIYELKRLHVDSTVTLSWFKGLLTCPRYFAANYMDD